MPVERIHISKSFVPYLSLLFWPSKCFVYIYVYEIERTCAWGEKKEATNYTYSKWWCVYVFVKAIIHSWQKKRKKEKKTCIVASFVLLIHAKNVKYQETHSRSFYSLYIYILLLHRNVDDDDDAILKRKKKKKTITKKTERENKKRKACESKLNLYGHEWPFTFETDMLIVPIMLLSNMWHLRFFLEISK
jgi:hypothetical protein